MRYRRSLAAAIAAASVATPACLAAAPASADTTPASTAVALPVAKYSHMLVDPVHRHIFVSSGTGYSSILVTDYSGNTVATISNEPGATGLALSSDGSTVYAALANGDAVSAISTSTLTETARYATGAGTQPAYVAYTSGKIWFGYGGAGQGGIGSIDPGTSPATVTLKAAAGFWYSAPMLAASANGELVAGETSQSPDQLASYDVSSGTAAVLAPLTYMNGTGGNAVASNMAALQITPDGKDVVVASGYPYYHQVFQVSDLSAAGEYPTTTYPDSVSIAADGTVAAGTDADNAVFVFAPGGSSPLNTYSFGAGTSHWLPADGVAITPDGSELFAVTATDDSGDNPTLNIIADPEQALSTLSLAGPATATHGQTITLSGTLGGPASEVGGRTLTVTRFDPADPDGVALPSVTTAADGSFSFTDTAPKAPGQDTSTVTYQVSYAGDAHLTAATASASVTVQNTGS